MPDFIPTQYETDEPFVASVAKMAAEYQKLSDAKLAKKIRHLRRAVNRCSLQRNADLIVAFHDVAMTIARKRVNSDG